MNNEIFEPFKWNLFIKIQFYSHLIVYLISAFIDFNLINGFINLFKSSGGRVVYLLCLFCFSFVLLPIVCPIKKTNNDE